MSLISAWSSTTPRLDTLKWKNRILLVFTPASQDQNLQAQAALIEKNVQGFEDRDFRVFNVVASAPDSENLLTRFQVVKSSFAVILIGKDGTEKLRTDAVIQPEKIFQLVDSMPLRRAGGR